MSEKIRDWESIKNSELLKKSKRGFFQFVFGRSFIMGMLFLFQILFFLWLGSLVTTYFFVAGAVTVLSFFLIVHIMDSEENIGFQLTWSIMIGVFPAFGIPLYTMMHMDYGQRIEKKYMTYVIEDSIEFVPRQPYVMKQLREENPHIYGLSEYLWKNGGYCAYTNSDVTYYSIGEDMIDALEAAIMEAKEYIFLEFFIIYKGEVWERILKALIEKAQKGVEVRLIYDGTLDISALPHSFPKQLQAVGIKCKMFMPLPILLSFSYNNRDHRKIVVIDGEIAFTGGVNLADEYANITHPLGHWKDVGVQIKGDAVLGFNLMFLQMWNSMESEVSYQPYLQLPKISYTEEKGYVIPYGDSPLDRETVGRNVYLDIISRAERYLYIMTPYLILDAEIKSALKFAVARGVDVRIIIPHTPDKKYAFALAVAHFKELTKAGIKLYEYLPGFVHAKMFVSDDIRGTVGSINLDFRSLYLHFECGVYLEGVSAIEDIKDDFEKTMEVSQLITPQLARKIYPIYRFFGKVLRVIAPLF